MSEKMAVVVDAAEIAGIAKKEKNENAVFEEQFFSRKISILKAKNRLFYCQDRWKSLFFCIIK